MQTLHWKFAGGSVLILVISLVSTWTLSWLNDGPVMNQGNYGRKRIHLPHFTFNSSVNSTLGTFDYLQSITRPLTITVMNQHYLGSYGQRVQNCSLLSRLLDCDIVEHDPPQTQITTLADAHWYFLPTLINARHQGLQSRNIERGQLRIGMSTESSVYYWNMNDPTFMCEFDLLMTYHLATPPSLIASGSNVAFPMLQHVRTTYFTNSPRLYQPAPIKTGDKLNAVVYMNSNCNAPSGRDDIVRSLMESGIRIDSFGGCLNNQPKINGRELDKFQLFQRYKFCVCIENSVDWDYVSEKLWEGLEAGCLPIYMGAPNIVRDFLPSPDSAIIFDPAIMTVEQLADELREMMDNTVLYDKRMEWRQLPLEQRSLGFQRLSSPTYKQEQLSANCQMCRQVAHHRAEFQRNPRAVYDLMMNRQAKCIQIQSNQLQRSRLIFYGSIFGISAGLSLIGWIFYRFYKK